MRPPDPRLVVTLVLLMVASAFAFVVATSKPAEGASPRDQIRVVTANIGRKRTPAKRAHAIRRTPLGITGWQEIDADDQGNEHRAIRNNRPRHARACWHTSVPVTVPPARRLVGQRVTFLSRAVPGITARRVLCEARLDHRTVILNAQLVSKAHSSGGGRKTLRRDLWARGYTRLWNRARHYADRGWRVYLTGDLNRARLPRPLPVGRVLMTRHNDYVIGRGRVLERRTVRLHIDGHRALRAIIN